jgi:predicted TIM-barrel fold metal-dependent hydrolase
MWEYPWREAVPTIKECVQRVGADRLIWGTDLPMVARFCTYRQTLDQYRAHCDFLSESELQDIIGGTAARVMGLGA